MIVYRLSKGRYHKDLSGKGAEMYGGRWNSKGTALVYTSESRALAFAEISMHIPLGTVPKDYFLTTIQIPETASIYKLSENDLPVNWRTNLHPDSTQKVGDKFAALLQHLALKVPSAVVPGDFNYLINPAHTMVKDITIIDVEPFEFDTRFASRGM